jgi:hypothetical protein
MKASRGMGAINPEKVPSPQSGKMPRAPVKACAGGKMAKGGLAWTRKEGKNPNGGLNAKGRASYNKAHGAHLKAPAPHPKTKKDAGRRKSFCARMSGMPGPMKDDKGRPTRKALSLRAWNC